MGNPIFRTLTIVSLLCLAATSVAVGQTARPSSTALEPGGSFAPMLERVIPAVVTIRVTGRKLRPIVIPARSKDGQRRGPADARSRGIRGRRLWRYR